MPAVISAPSTLAGSRAAPLQRRAGGGGGRAAAVAPRAASTRLPSSAPCKSKESVRAGEMVSIFTTLGLTGASIGTYMDGIHSSVGVLIYDKLPLVHGGLHTSGFVPPLLAAFYLALGGLYLTADGWLLQRGDAATEAAFRRCNLGTMCLSFGAVAATLALSSGLYSAEVSPDQISVALMGCAALNYLVFDGTKQGLALGLLCALVCPASELMLMHILQLWHYPEATIMTEIPHSGMLAWVPWCYFAYTPALAQLARFLRKTA